LEIFSWTSLIKKNINNQNHLLGGDDKAMKSEINNGKKVIGFIREKNLVTKQIGENK
jgi:hypothetical protein